MNQARAQAEKDKDKDAARTLLEIANNELDTMELGYTPADSEYKALRDEISNLRKQLKRNEDTSSLFSKIKERPGSLTRQAIRQTDAVRRKKPAAQGSLVIVCSDALPKA